MSQSESHAAGKEFESAREQGASGTDRRGGGISRRDILAGAVATAAAGLMSGCASGDRSGSVMGNRGGPGLDGYSQAPAIGSSKSLDRIRVGVIGCGGRGTGAAMDCVKANQNIEIWALGDLFRDRLDGSREQLKKLGDAYKVTDDRCFTGFDNAAGVIGSGVDLVILATPPGFRPAHLKAAIDAGKHVFMEKPVAVDPVGVRSVIASSELAASKGLGIVCGTQRRHDPAYMEAIRRVHSGRIGEIVAAQCYWNQEGLWVHKPRPEWTDMEWQCRNWLYFTWLSGDHIVEQHVHNLDVINWALKAVPVKCVGMGGRQRRVEPEFGNVYDHFAVEYEYPGGVRVLSTCRQTEGASSRVSERVVGTRGTAYMTGNSTQITVGKSEWKYDDKGKPINPYEQEHADLVASIRAGKPLNEGRRIAESTLTAIMGRMSAYTGREVSWDWVMNASKLDLTPARLELGPIEVGEVAIPGKTKLV